MCMKGKKVFARLVANSCDELIVILLGRSGVSNYVQIAVLKIRRFTKTDVIKCT